MNNPSRVDVLYQTLKNAFQPSLLRIQDDSAHHIGHIGSQNGAGHYSLQIAAACFNDLAAIDAHRLIYTALAEWIPDQIHALTIKIVKLP